ncbi:MAG: hypothetical protein ABEJ06_00895 [Haloarculaceae archaeon]
MVAGDRATGTVGRERTATSERTLRECRHRIAELEAENERLARELAERERNRQTIIDHYERVVERHRHTPEAESPSGKCDLLSRARDLLF